MKYLLALLCFLTCFAAMSYAQSDTNGDPDIFLPVPNIRTIQHPIPPIILPEIGMILTITLGNDTPSDGPVTPPPPLGYWWKPSTPTAGGTDYWKLTGTINGQPFELCMQQYMSQGLHPEDKCNKAANAINYASDHHTSGKDPVNATVNGETGKVEVKPNEGCTLNSSEIENGSQEESDEAGEISDSPEPAPEKSTSGSYRLFTISIPGSPTGNNYSGATSYISFGVGACNFSTFADPTESTQNILRRFKIALWLMGINAKFGTDQYGEKYLIFISPSPNVYFGTTDTGLHTKIIMARTAEPLLKSGTTHQVGTKKIVVDPDEAMPHYIPN